MTSTLPAPRLIDPTSVPALRWGVVGAGSIATAFVRAVRGFTAQNVVAIASRSPERAQRLAQSAGVETVHESVEALVADPRVDVVYIATPHTEHRNGALAAIGAGKHVLVEKPFTVTEEEATEVVNAARRAGVFAMEAMWPRYGPYFDVVRQSLAQGDIGDVHLVTADFGFVAPFAPEGRMWNPGLGGGALLDAGVYPISFASFVLGSPAGFTVHGARTETEVDAMASLLLDYGAGVTAQVATSMVSVLPSQATIVGTQGRIELPGPFFAPAHVTLTTLDGGARRTSTWSGTSLPTGRDALSFQATALAQYVGEGRAESPLQSLEETVAIIATVQEARGRILA